MQKGVIINDAFFSTSYFVLLPYNMYMAEDIKEVNIEQKIEAPLKPESAVETSAENKAGEQAPEAETAVKDGINAAETKTYNLEPKTYNPVSAAPDETVIKVEKVLEENIAPYFARLTPDQQHKFKTEGEKVTKEIAQCLKEVKVNVARIFQLIWAWLMFLPGVNKIFLQQEAKIKTDKILRIKDSQN